MDLSKFFLSPTELLSQGKFASQYKPWSCCQHNCFPLHAKGSTIPLKNSNLPLMKTRTWEESKLAALLTNFFVK